MLMHRYLVWFLILGAALALGLYFLWPAVTPEGQPPLEQLKATNARQFADHFNRAAANVRMVLLLSPT
jgi:hypothetical protein